MRALGPALLISFGLWATLAWCFVGLCTLVGTSHVQLGARELGAWLLGIDVIFLYAVLWFDGCSEALPD